MAGAVIAAVFLGAAAPRADALTKQALNGAFVSPLQVVSAPGDPRLFVVQQGGSIKVYENDAIRSADFLTLGSKAIYADGEQGLLSLAFAPDYPTTPYFFIAYTGAANATDTPPNGAGDLVVSRFSVSSDPEVADADSEQRLLVVPHPGQPNHNAGQLQFGPDGDLYVSTGDGGGGGDPNGNAQNLGSLLGKVLRIDPLSDPDTAPHYEVPAGNPFPAADSPFDTIWSYGLRNPWRFSFDSLTGDLAIGDVGQVAREEIDYAPHDGGGAAGANFGWNCREGLIAYTDPGASCAGTSNFTEPVFDYRHSDPTPLQATDNAFGCALIGGYVYRGTAIPGLGGRYVYSDNCNGDIRSQLLCPDGSVDDRSEGVSANRPGGFGQGSDGELYVASVVPSGAVYKLTGSSAISTASCSSSGPPPPNPTPPASSSTPGGSDRNAAIRRCKKKHRGANRRRCIKKAKSREARQLT
jgi:glucose/arabinose dehydrogenase